MHSQYKSRTPAFALASLAGLAFIGGCCTHHHTTAYAPTRHYAQIPTTTQPQALTPTGRTETETVAGGNTNMVIPLYQESINVGKREVDAGSVRLKKTVKTETVNQPVELRHEEIVIDRQPASGQSQGQGQAFQESETVIPLKREVAVVEKQTSPSGEIVVQTRSSSSSTNVQAEVRREDIDVAKQGDTKGVIIGQNVQGSASSSATGAAETKTGQSTGAGSSGPITDPAMLSSSTDASQYSGRQVQFSGLKVQNVIGDRLLVVDAGNGQPIYVVSNEPVTAKAGDTVDLQGSVKATSGSDAGLTGDAAQKLSSNPFYVQAQKVQSANQ